MTNNNTFRDNDTTSIDNCKYSYTYIHTFLACRSLTCSIIQMSSYKIFEKKKVIRAVTMRRILAVKKKKRKKELSKLVDPRQAIGENDDNERRRSAFSLSSLPHSLFRLSLSSSSNNHARLVAHVRT